MSKLAAKVFNERLKAFVSVVNTLASGVLLLGLIKPNLEGSPIAADPSWAPPDYDIYWIAAALLGYGLSFYALGRMKDEAEGEANDRQRS